jgi:phage-related holin
VNLCSGIVSILIVVILPQFWEKVIPKADRLPFSLIIRFISNPAIQGLRRSAKSGTPLG